MPGSRAPDDPAALPERPQVAGWSLVQAGDSEVAVEFSQVVARREQMPFLNGVAQAA